MRGRGDPLVPNQVLYQAEPLPDDAARGYREALRLRRYFSMGTTIIASCFVVGVSVHADSRPNCLFRMSLAIQVGSPISSLKSSRPNRSLSKTLFRYTENASDLMESDSTPI